MHNWGQSPPNPRDRSFFIWDVIGFAWPQEVNKFGVHAFKTNPVIVRLVIVALRHMLLIIGTFCWDNHDVEGKMWYGNQCYFFSILWCCSSGDSP